MSNYIVVQDKRYYYYGKYSTWNEAREIARYEKKKNKKCQYYILKMEEGYLFPYEIYKLYLTKVMKLGIWN